MGIWAILAVAVVCLVIGVICGASAGSEGCPRGCAVKSLAYHDDRWDISRYGLWQPTMYHTFYTSEAYESGRSVGRSEGRREATYDQERMRHLEAQRDCRFCPQRAPAPSCATYPGNAALMQKYREGKRAGWKDGQLNMRNRIQVNMPISSRSLERGYPVEPLPGEVHTA